MVDDVLRFVDYEPLSDALGVQVFNLNLANKMTIEQSLALNTLLAMYCVIYFSQQSLSEEEQVAFGENFGKLKQNLRDYKATKNPAIMYVTNEIKDGELQGALPDGEMYFHADMCYLESPAKASILYGISIPSNGGNTLFANMNTAFETLPEKLKHAISDKKAINSYDPGKSNYASTRFKSNYVSETELSFAQPMVFKHPLTGRKALYVNRVMTKNVVGLSECESNALLEQLFRHQEQDQFIYSHHWTPGDVIMWDNRSTLHARTDFNAKELRKLRRVTISGEALI